MCCNCSSGGGLYLKASLCGLIICAALSIPANAKEAAKENCVASDRCERQWFAPQFEFKHKVILTGGANNQLNKPQYGTANVNATLGAKWQNGYGLKIHARGEQKHFDEQHKNNKHENLFSAEGVTPAGTLYFGAIKNKGASELFYRDVNAMAIDVVEYKRQYNSLTWKGKAGDFGYAISRRDLGDGEHNDMSYGAQYRVNGWSFAAGYDKKSIKQKQAVGATVQYQHKAGDVQTRYTLSAIRRPEQKEHAIGVAVQSRFSNGLTIGADYAFNHVKKRENGYGFDVRYKQDNWSLKGKWEYTEKGERKSKINGQIDFANLAPKGTTLYGGYEYKEGSSTDTGFYAAALFGVHEKIRLGISHSAVDEAGDYDFLLGNSVFFRAEL